MAEPATGELRYRGAATRHQRRQDQRHLVTDAAGRVLVYGGRGHRAEIKPLAGTDHRVSPGPQLSRGQPAEEDSHRHRGHLLVGDLAAGIRVD